MEIIKSLTHCKSCNEELENPISFPCDHTICQKHVDALINNFRLNCPVCNQSHNVPAGGFPVNEMTRQLLKLNDLNLVQSVSPFQKETLDNMKHLDVAINNDLNKWLDVNKQCIIDYNSNFINQIDLKREKLHKQVNDSSEKLIQEVNEHKKKYLEDLANIKRRVPKKERKLLDIILLHKGKIMIAVIIIIILMIVGFIILVSFFIFVIVTPITIFVIISVIVMVIICIVIGLIFFFIVTPITIFVIISVIVMVIICIVIGLIFFFIALGVLVI
jgi:hypothetical protein